MNSKANNPAESAEASAKGERKKLTEKDVLAWRKARVAELHAQFLTQQQIADNLGVSQPTVSNIIAELNAEAESKLQEVVKNLAGEQIRDLRALDLVIAQGFKELAVDAEKQPQLIGVLVRAIESRQALLQNSNSLNLAIKHSEGLKAKIKSLDEQTRRQGEELRRIAEQLFQINSMLPKKKRIQLQSPTDLNEPAF